MEKRKRENKKYSPEYKLCVILDMRENGLGYMETARKYGLVRQSMGGAVNTIHRWERIYLEEGAEGLKKERRGRATMADSPKKGRPRLKPAVEEDLIAENQRLRMKIEYIKKLSALVLADERKNGKRR